MADPDVMSHGEKCGAFEDPRGQEGKILKPSKTDDISKRNADAQANSAALDPSQWVMLKFVKEDFNFNPVKPWHISPLLRPPEPTPCKKSLVLSRERRTFCDPKKPYRRMYTQIFGDLTVAESMGMGKGEVEGEGEGKD